MLRFKGAGAGGGDNLLQMLGFDFKKVSQLRRFSEEFEDLGQIGSGGFAEVHRVRNWLDQRIYAAKIVKIKPSCTDDKEDNRLQRAFAEAKAQSHLSHPNIVQYHGCWVELQPFSEEERAEMMEEEQQSEPEFEMILLNESLSSDGIVFGSNSSSDPQQEPLQQQPPKRQKCKKLGDGSALQDYKEIRLFILTELCEMNLQALIYRRSLDRMERDLQPKEILQNYQISLDMMNGLNYLHTKRYIHRDIKLHNIMVGADGNCKLIDFGLAKWVKYWKTSIEDQHITSFEKVAEGEDKYSSSIGTKLFSSPEQASCERYDYRTDLYSLAIVIVLLFHSYTTAHQQRDLLEKVRKRSLQEMKIPQPLKALLFRCLGGENERPSLSQLKKCVRDLMRELILKENLHYSASKKHSVFEKLEEVVEKPKPGKSQKKMKLVAVQES